MFKLISACLCLAMAAFFTATCGSESGGEACQADSCSFHGTCDDSSGSIVCTCDTGYGGDDCGSCDTGYNDYGDGECRPSDPCAGDVDCAGQNRACENNQGVAECGDCLAGYHEENGACVADVSCEANTCNGHGSCDDTGGTPVCSCDPEYAGEHCEGCADGYHDENGECLEDVPCGAGSCSGHGTCDDSSGLPVCTCDDEYQGDDCSDCAEGYAFWPADGDTCLDDPCLPDPCDVDNGVVGSCVQTGVDQVQCDCDTDYVWTGDACIPSTTCEDNDGDGYGVGPGCTGTDCDDEDDTVYEGAVELCDGKDNDCDTSTDEDFPDLGDACTAGLGICEASGNMVCNSALDGTECDAVPLTGETEDCTGLDDDCDGDTDEELDQEGQPCENTVGGVGTCMGVYECLGSAGWFCNGPIPEPEICDDVDNECDGDTDEDFSYVDYDGSVLLKGMDCGTGACAGGTTVCTADTTGLTCSSLVNLGPDLCDGVDNDCDGTTDEDFVQGGSLPYDGGPYPDDAGKYKGESCGVGWCAGGTVVCDSQGLALTCSTLPSAGPEVCDGEDNDCDGLLDSADAEDLLANDSQTCELTGGVCADCDKPADLCQGGAWNPCDAAAYSACNAAYEHLDELSCDGVDNNCDGLTDILSFNSDPLDCGGCGVTCGSDTGGLCCGGLCRASDMDNCGACDHACDEILLLTSEIMANPDATSEPDGEWFEVLNTSAFDIDMRGFVIEDNVGSHTISSPTPVTVSPGDRIVLGRSEVAATGLVDYVYGTLALSNSGDEVHISAYGYEIDVVTYSSTIPGRSMAWNESGDNSDPANWCTSSTPMSDGDFGTPGAPNDCP